MLSERALNLLVCPACTRHLEVTRRGAKCSACDVDYPLLHGTQLDMRLRTPKKCVIDVELPGACEPELEFEFAPLRPRSRHGQTLANPALKKELTFGNRLTPELLSHFPIASQPGGFMLDLGCGDREFAAICRDTNLEYIGTDYRGDAADLLSDAHALPFVDSAFDFILSVAVLEHLRHPLIAMREAYRVLKPGGVLVGTVAFLEPFHMDSFYHHTHLGTYNVLHQAGFDVRQVAPNLKWTGLRALSNMSLFPRLPRFATYALTLPLHVLHRLWWQAGKLITKKESSSERLRQLATTGGYRFVAVKPDRDELRVQRQSAATGASGRLLRA